MDAGNIKAAVEGASGVFVIFMGYLQFLKGKKIDSNEKAIDRQQTELAGVHERNNNMQAELDKVRETALQLERDNNKLQISLDKKVADFEHQSNAKDDLHVKQIELLKAEYVEQIRLLKEESVEQIKLLKAEHIEQIRLVREENTLLKADNINLRAKLAESEVIGIMGRGHLEDKTLPAHQTTAGRRATDIEKGSDL